MLNRDTFRHTGRTRCKYDVSKILGCDVGCAIMRILFNQFGTEVIEKQHATARRICFSVRSLGEKQGRLRAGKHPCQTFRGSIYIKRHIGATSL